jgi:superfamily II DNA or RNA helicase
MPVPLFNKGEYETLIAKQAEEYLKEPSDEFLIPELEMEKDADLLPNMEMQDHQKKLLKRFEGNEKGRALLYWGLGSGKTSGGLAAAEQLGKPYTAIVPASLRNNMYKERAKWTDEQTPADVMSYSAIAQGKPVDKTDTLIFDEAQRLRNAGSKQTIRAKELAEKAKRVILLSGTPIVNDPTDLATPLSMLTNQNITPKDFSDKYIGEREVRPSFFQYLRGVTPGTEEYVKNEDELRSLLKGHVDYYAPEKPTVPTSYKDVPVEMGTEQSQLYRAMYNKLPWVLKWKLRWNFPLSNKELVNLTSFLSGPREVGLSTYPFQKNKDPYRAYQQSTKLQKAMELLGEKLKDQRTKALIFSNYVDAGLTPYQAALQKAKIPAAIFHGGLSDNERRKLVEDYNNNKLRVALLGPSGSEGLSFKGTNLIQLLDPHWNSVRGKQSTGRGIRFDSHWGLPEDLQNVEVQRFISKLPLGFWQNMLHSTVGTDYSSEQRAADDYLLSMQARKDKSNQKYLDLLKEVGSQHEEPIKEARMRYRKGGWVKYVMENYTSTDPPKGIFTRSAEEVADAADTKGVAPKGLLSFMRMTQFHINRSGKNMKPERKAELQKAIKLMSDRMKERKKHPETYDPKTLLKKGNILAHIAGPSGSGKSTILEDIKAKHPNLATKDLDDFDDEAVEQLGWKGLRKNDKNYTDEMLKQLADTRQLLQDKWLAEQTNPAVLAGHHTEGKHVLSIPSENKLLLNTSPLLSTWRGYLRSKKQAPEYRRTLLELPHDWSEARKEKKELQELGYKPTTKAQILDFIDKQAASAKGIPDRSTYGDLDQLQAGQLLDYVRKRHHAARAGLHEDVRFGSPEHGGLYSWAARKGLPEPGKKHLAVMQPIHSMDDQDFEGDIPEGYGKGKVEIADKGKVLITNVSPEAISFTTAHTGTPQRYALIKPKDQTSKNWLLINNSLTSKDVLDTPKLHYKVVEPEDVAPILDSLSNKDSVQAKIDGAANLTKLLSKHVDTRSFRTSKKTDGPISYDEKLFHSKPEIPIPKEYRNSVLRGEIYGTKDDRAIPVGQLSGLLNSSIAKSISSQNEQNVQLKNMIFDIAQLGKKKIDINKTPYQDRYKLIQDIVKHLPQDKYHVPEQATTPEDARKMWEDINLGKNPLTQEGIVIHPSTGNPIKTKIRPDYDVHIREMFPGLGKYQDVGAGGFRYSLTPTGPITGKVGTGFTDDIRKDMWANPNNYVGRVARVKAHEQLPSGALRVPAFIALHEDYPMKSASVISGLESDTSARVGRVYTVKDLMEAKKESDRRNYAKKQQILRDLMKQYPDHFLIDTPGGKFVGITHKRTGFQFHLPRNVIPDIMFKPETQPISIDKGV